MLLQECLLLVLLYQWQNANAPNIALQRMNFKYLIKHYFKDPLSFIPERKNQLNTRYFHYLTCSLDLVSDLVMVRQNY